MGLETGESSSSAQSVPLAAIIKPGRPRRHFLAPPSASENRLSLPCQSGESSSELVSDETLHQSATPPFSSASSVEATQQVQPSASSQSRQNEKALPTPTLADLIPQGADPVWASRLAMSLAVECGRIPRTPSENAWFTKVFSEDYLAAYPPAESQQEAVFIQNALSVSEGARLLDLGCGYGRHALPLTRAGFEVVGLDLSLPMLKHGLALAQAESLGVQFVHGDMRDLDFEEMFNGVLCMGHTFGYFSEAENMLVLRGIHRALCSGSRLLLELINRDAWVNRLPMRTWFEGNNCLIQEDIDLDPLQSRLEVRRFMVFADERDRMYDISLRLYSLNEIRALLEVVGFKLLTVSGSIHTPGAYFGSRSERLLILAEKK